MAWFSFFLSHTQKYCSLPLLNVSFFNFAFSVPFQTKLNCEVLYDNLGFELRWVMDGDDIVMQLVGKVGKCYLA